MDLYGISFGDEAGYVHNARNKALFGDWKLEGDLWNPIYLSPVLTYAEYVSFELFGVRTFSARIINPEAVGKNLEIAAIVGSRTCGVADSATITKA